MSPLVWIGVIWGMTVLSCYPEDVGDDDTTGIPADDDTADDDSAASDDDDDDDSADTEPFGDQDHDGYTVQDGDCDDSDPTLNPADADADGQSTCDGDCDDDNPAIYLGADDICDDFDNDCDGELNEDTPGAADAYEPNDAGGYDLGSLAGQETAIQAYIHTPGDLDLFEFYVEDTLLDDVTVEVDLHTVPAGLNLALELFFHEDENGQYMGQSLTLVDDGGLGEGEYFYWSGDFWSDDTGTYQLVVSASWGYECEEPYTFSLIADG